jgi:hypothetical protein
MKAYVTAIERRWLLLLLPVVLVVAGLVGLPMVLGTANAAPVEVTYGAAQAGYIANSAPEANYSSSEQLRLGDTTYDSYVSFPAVHANARQVITAAVLRVHVNKAVKARAGVLRVQATTNSWSSTELTRVTAPSVVTGDVAAPVTVAEDTTLEIPLAVDSLADDLASGVSLRLQHTGADAGVAVDKSGADAPSLTVTIDSGSTAPTSTTSGSSASATSSASGSVATAATASTTQPATTATSASASAQASRAAVQSGKLVFAHYFPPYPISLDNRAADEDYYAKNYLRADGEDGKYASVGGLLRDRPVTRTALSGDYRTADYLTEIRQAQQAGIDGFAVDILGLSGDNWDRTVKLLRAAESFDGFKIMLQPDMSAMSGVTKEALAKSLAQLASSPSAYRLSNGQVVISPFYTEGKSASWWQDVLNQLDSTYAVKATMLPLFLDASKMSDYASISYGFGNWGERDPAVIKKTSDSAAKAHKLGKKWMEPVSVQDERPNGKTFSEAGNTEALRASWGKAIGDDADLVLLTTWNDYSEGTSFAPSVGHGDSFLDISSYYATKFKTGSYPQIKDDTVYITHRVQKADAKPGYSGVMVQRKTDPMTDARDTVEVLTFLAKAATVNVTVGGTDYSYEAPAGVYAKDFKLESGYSTATAIRSGTVAAQATTKDVVKSSTTQQDLSYHAVSSADG